MLLLCVQNMNDYSALSYRCEEVLYTILYLQLNGMFCLQWGGKLLWLCRSQQCPLVLLVEGR